MRRDPFSEAVLLYLILSRAQGVIASPRVDGVDSKMVPLTLDVLETFVAGLGTALKLWFLELGYEWSQETLAELLSKMEVSTEAFEKRVSEVVQDLLSDGIETVFAH